GGGEGLGPRVQVRQRVRQVAGGAGLRRQGGVGRLRVAHRPRGADHGGPTDLVPRLRSGGSGPTPDIVRPWRPGTRSVRGATFGATRTVPSPRSTSSGSSRRHGGRRRPPTSRHGTSWSSPSGNGLPSSRRPGYGRGT